MKNLLFIVFIIVVTACIKSDDKMITSQRAGILKIGQSEESFTNKISGYKVIKYNHDNPTLRYSFYEVYDSKVKIMELKFANRKLVGIKIFSSKYYLKRSVKVGITAQQLLDRGSRLHNISSKNRYLTAKLAQKDLKGNFKNIDNISLIFSKHISKGGRIGKNAELKAIIIGQTGDYIDDLKYEIYEKKLSQIVNSKYINRKFGFNLPIPNDWDHELNKVKTDYFAELLYLTRADQSVLFIDQTIHSYQTKSGYQYLKKSMKDLHKIEHPNISDIFLGGKKFSKCTIEIDEKYNTFYAYYFKNHVLLITTSCKNQEKIVSMENLLKTISFN